MKKVAIALVILAVLFWLVFPSVLKGLGLHPDCPPFEGDLSGRSALVISTSHRDMCGDAGGETGVAASELIHPYYEFLDAGMRVDVASIQGGVIPMEPGMLGWPIAGAYEKRFLADPAAQEWVAESLKIDDIDFTQYDVVFIAGGWGAAFDLGQSEVLGDKMTEANAAGALLGAVCHGPLGLIRARKVDGTPLLEGVRATGVTDEAVAALGITCTPMHPETEMRKVGAIFEEDHDAVHEFFTNYRTQDGNLFTGMNQNASCSTAQDIMLSLLSQ
ncbi:MAG: type 1 glutamine amidotransferase domain-containing protein [Myxococcota bacterium]|nr:type 1 glutamine amidotransferase domain-containing protein [Myxococcota bacterium]